MVGRFAITLAFVFVSIYFITIILSYIPPTTENEISFTIRPDNIILHETNLTQQQWRQWKHVLQNNKIISIQGLGNDRLADQFLVELEGGFLATGKLCHPDTYVSFEFPIVSFQDAAFPDLIDPQRANRKYQGWSEAAASAVASFFLPQKKLPSIMRSISSSTIWNCEGYISWESRFKYWTLPEREILISLYPYIDVLTPWIPPISYKTYLTDPYANPSDLERFNLKTAGDISDILVLDYLIDDHERRKTRNWVLDTNGNLIFWENGLAWAHGPAGRETCFNILCGPEKWQKSPTCTPICKFRESTVKILSEISPTGEGEYLLGDLVRSELSKYPVFEYAVYYLLSSARPKHQYPPSDFFTAMDHKVARFLAHVDSCIFEYGHDFVFDSFGE